MRSECKRFLKFIIHTICCVFSAAAGKCGSCKAFENVNLKQSRSMFRSLLYSFPCSQSVPVALGARFSLLHPLLHLFTHLELYVTINLCPKTLSLSLHPLSTDVTKGI